MSDMEAALGRVLERLSSVRAAMNEDEQVLLDAIVEQAQISIADEAAEVEPHAAQSDMVLQKVFNITIDRDYDDAVYKVRGLIE